MIEGKLSISPMILTSFRFALQEDIKKQLDTVITDVEQLEGSLVDLLNVNENIYLLNTDAKQLTTILKNSSTLSTKINVQIHELDVARVGNFLLVA